MSTNERQFMIARANRLVGSTECRRPQVLYSQCVNCFLFVLVRYIITGLVESGNMCTRTTRRVLLASSVPGVVRHPLYHLPGNVNALPSSFGQSRTDEPPGIVINSSLTETAPSESQLRRLTGEALADGLDDGVVFDVVGVVGLELNGDTSQGSLESLLGGSVDHLGLQLC